MTGWWLVHTFPPEILPGKLGQMANLDLEVKEREGR